MKELEELLDRLIGNKYFLIAFCLFMLWGLLNYENFSGTETPQPFVGPLSLQEQLVRNGPVFGAILGYCAEKDGRNPDLPTRRNLECANNVTPVAIRVLSGNEALFRQVEECSLLGPNEEDLDDLELTLEKFDLEKRCVREVWPDGFASLFE